MKLKRTHDCGELRKEQVGTEVILNGWVESCRNHGGLLFVDLRDRYGITQCQLDPATTVGAEEFKTESVIAVRGKVTPRPDGNVNPNRATGEIEIMAEECELLGACKTPPFEVVEDIETREELRLEHRYLDMRRRTLTKAMVLRSEVTRIIREVFHDENFVDVETPLLTKTTPEGARDFIVPSRLQPGKVYALPQSPQLFKQTLMVCGARPLLPDLQVSPRRGPAGGPSARVHAARHGDVLRRTRRRLRGDREDHRASLSGTLKGMSSCRRRSRA